MECIIPGNNMKVLGKALQALSKVGDELFLEAKKDSLSLITLHPTKTVCARFQFLDTFFSSYEVNHDDLKANDDTITCKVHLKIFLPLFKGALEKKLDFFKIEYTSHSDSIVFKMKYRCDEIIMVHKLHLMETETLSIGVLINSGCNNIEASSSFYTQLLTMFNSSDNEVTFEINESKIVARNYCIGTPCRPKMMRTQINLNSTEFIAYKIEKNTSINFSLRPFRTLVHFAENFNLNIDFNFEIGGRPLSMILKNPTFEVSFIVATLDPYTDPTNTSVATTTVQNRPKSNVTSADLEAMDGENWDNNDLSKESSFIQLMKQGKNTESEDVLPKSPESPALKKAKMAFGRCYDRTFHETLLGEVLTANSDSE